MPPIESPEATSLESELARRVQSLETVLATVVDFNYSFDREGRFSYVNKALADLLLRTPASMIGLNFHELGYPTELATRLQRQIEFVFTTGETLRDETPFTAAGGETGYYEYVFVPAFADDGAINMVAGSTRDITERKRIELALKESEHKLHDQEERLRLALNAGNCGTWDWDVATNRVTWSERVYDLHGIKPGEFNGAVEDFTKLIHPDDVHRVAETIQACLTKGGDYAVEFRVPHLNGDIRWLSTNGRVIRDGEGRPIRMVGTTWDTTDRKETEKNLLQQAEDLWRSNQELAEFAYVASHDLKEPLRKVANYAQLLVRRVSNDIDGEGQRYLDHIQGGLERMQHLIDDLLAYSRLSNGEKQSQTVEIDEVLTQVTGDLETAMAQSGATITRDALPTVSANPLHMQQLFQNLISNAIKFRDSRAPVIHVSAVEKDGLCVFSVADNGIGIEPKYLDQIFKIFHRLHGRERYTGTGIGLAICKKIVETYGGKIWATSKPDAGSTFFFSLPRA